jgi:hypothetical protein
MSRRERPQLVLSAQGQPRYFSSGVQDVAVRNILMFKLNLFGEPFLNVSQTDQLTKTGSGQRSVTLRKEMVRFL